MSFRNHLIQFSHSVMSNSLRSHGLQHARPPCPSPTHGACSDLWCHPTILSSVIMVFPCLQSFPESGSFQVSQFFTSGGQSIGVSASTSVLPKNIQDWFPLELNGLILQSKELSIYRYSYMSYLISVSHKTWLINYTVCP